MYLRSNYNMGSNAISVAAFALNEELGDGSAVTGDKERRWI